MSVRTGWRDEHCADGGAAVSPHTMLILIRGKNPSTKFSTIYAPGQFPFLSPIHGARICAHGRLATRGMSRRCALCYPRILCPCVSLWCPAMPLGVAPFVNPSLAPRFFACNMRRGHHRRERARHTRSLHRLSQSTRAHARTQTPYCLLQSWVRISDHATWVLS